MNRALKTKLPVVLVKKFVTFVLAGIIFVITDLSFHEKLTSSIFRPPTRSVGGLYTSQSVFVCLLDFCVRHFQF